MALSGHVLIRGWDVTPRGLSLWGRQGWGERKRLGPGEVAAGLAQGGWLQALQAAGGQAAAQQHLSPARSILTKSWKQGSAPHLLPWGFCCLVSCFCLFSPAEQLLFCSLCLQALGLPDVGLPWSCLSLSPSQAPLFLLGPENPFSGVASAAHLHPPYFV